MYLASLLVFLLLLTWLGTLIYLSSHKKSIISTIESELQKRTNAEISIGDIDISLFKTFPLVSIEFQEVTLRDSLWIHHHHDLLHAKKIFAGISMGSLISGHLQIRKLIIANADIYLFTDSNGYRNVDIFRKRPDGSQKSEIWEWPELTLSDVDFVVEKKDRNKYYHFGIEKFNCVPETEDKKIHLHSNLLAIVHNLEFNRESGSFLKEKPVTGKFMMDFFPATKLLQCMDIHLQINGHAFSLDGKFFTDVVPLPFLLKLRCNEIDYTEAESLLTPRIQAKLNFYGSTGPLKLVALIDGTNTDFREPVISVRASTTRSNLAIPAGIFSAASFEGEFKNQADRKLPPGDENSTIEARNFRADWQQVPIRSSRILITNLLKPQLTCDIRSDLNLDLLNSLSGSQTMKFIKGKGKIDVVFKSPLAANDSAETSLNGTLQIDSASIEYLPRHFELKELNAMLRFTDENLLVESLRATRGSTQLKMSGAIKNFLGLLYRNPDKLVLDWTISSPRIHLEDFTGFISKEENSVAAKTVKAGFAKTAQALDKMLRGSRVNLRLRTNEISYRSFLATDFSAHAGLEENSISLDQVSFSHAGGHILFDGNLQQRGTENPFTMHAVLQNVELPGLFSAFHSFGQNAIQEKNIAGKINAEVKIDGSLTDKAAWIRQALKGTIDFSILNGELINFEPMQQISASAFHGRDFSHVKFAELKDNIQVNGTGFQFGKMEIRSNVLSMFVEGIYDLKKGADMSIRFPVSNLKAKDGNTIPVNTGKAGLSVRLHAKTGEDGKLKLTWDPFNKAIKHLRKNGKNENTE